MLARFAAFVIWASVAALAAFWALRLLAQPTPMPARTTMVATAGANQGDLSRLFGSDAPAAVAAAAAAQSDARFQLVGVVAPRSPAARAQGLAVIAFDGGPAKTYRVGAAVDGDLVLQEVRARGAALGPEGQPAQIDLELAALLPPATGLLPPSRVDGATAPTVPSITAVPGRPAAPSAAMSPAPAPQRVRPGYPAARRGAQ